jgi:hypothetical protein
VNWSGCAGDSEKNDGKARGSVARFAPLEIHSRTPREISCAPRRSFGEQTPRAIQKSIVYTTLVTRAGVT